MKNYSLLTFFLETYGVTTHGSGQRKDILQTAVWSQLIAGLMTVGRYVFIKVNDVISNNM